MSRPSTLLWLALAGALTLGVGCTPPEQNASAPQGSTVKYERGSGSEDVTVRTGVAAVVNGEEISFDELDKSAAAKLVRVRTQAYEIRKQALDELIDTRLLEAEAKQRGQTVDELVAQEVTAKTPAVSEEEAKAFFEKNPRRGMGSFDAAKPQVMEFLKKQREFETRAAFIKTLRADAGVIVNLEPLRFDVSFDLDKDPIKGSQDAPVVIVIFSDFQCPYCSRAVPTLHRIEKEYGEKVAMVFRNFPLPFHNNAVMAAQAGQCAHDQGKFWEMHDKLFESQSALKVEDLKGYAKALELDTAAFDTCLDSGKNAQEVEDDKAAGAAVGVAGTPAFFVNGQFINGARPYEDFATVIDAELKDKGLL